MSKGKIPSPKKATSAWGRLKTQALGLAAGFLNGLFGSGGGMAAVPMLRGLGLSDEEAHSTSLSVILPMAAVSVALYLSAGTFELGNALPYLPGGVLGAIFGAWLLPKLKAVWIRRIFGIVVLFSAGRLLLR